jgi:hypothetical protein
MDCLKFKQVDIENSLKSAIFTIQDLIDEKPPQLLVRPLTKVLDILENQLEKEQNGDFN